MPISIIIFVSKTKYKEKTYIVEKEKQLSACKETSAEL